MKKQLLKTIEFLLILGLILPFTSIYAQTNNKSQSTQNDQCLSCHTEMEVLPEDYNPDDIHLQWGLTCAGCHGGNPKLEDPDEAMSKKYGFLGAPARASVPQFCGRCHSDINFMRQFKPQVETDQLSQYFTSVHGQQFKKGDEKVATCIDCHSTHSILPAKDPRSSVYPTNVPLTCKKCHADPEYMKSYNLPTDQFEKYAQSVHGVALLKNKDTGAAACNDCHGNHGARPPGATSIAQICGQCHPNNTNYFMKTRMAKAYRTQGLHDCVVCHGQHDIRKPTDEMIGTTGSSICIRCHTKESKGFQVADSINKELTQLTRQIETAKRQQLEIQRTGLDDIDIDFLIKEAHQNLVHARTLVHTFDPKKVGEKTKEGLQKAKEATETAIRMIQEFNKSKWTFLGLTFFTTILIIGLIFKVRNMEKSKNNSK